eukprot:gene54501-72833_t
MTPPKPAGSTFEQRLNGATYEEIARAGGGIVSSMTATRAASEDDLYASALTRLAGLKATGVTTVEIKSGYGLDRDSELKMLRVARRIGREARVRVRTSYLGLHAVPPEHRTDRSAYVDLAIDDILPAAHAEGLVDAVDAYCEPIAFSDAEVSRLFEKAKALGLPVKLHAEQLSDQRGAELVARFNGLSADHLEHLSADGIAAMAASGTSSFTATGNGDITLTNAANDFNTIGLNANSGYGGAVRAVHANALTVTELAAA